MSKRSYTACYIHLIWGVKERLPLLRTKEVRIKVNKYIHQYAVTKNIPIKVLFTNSDHIHLLIELPTNKTIEGIVKLIKGSSSHWINQNDIIEPKFSWAVGYAAFTVSKMNIGKVFKYILNQEEHHKKLTFKQEYDRFIKSYCNAETDKSV